MAKFKPLRRIIKRVRKNNHSGREREACRTTSNRSRRWIGGVIWPRKRSTATNSATGLPRRRRRLLPSFSCFKKKKNPARRSFGKDCGRGGRMLRLMSSFLKKRDEPACTQENNDEDNEANPHDSYILSMGGINILVEPYCHPADHTAAADSTSISCHQIVDYTTTDCGSLVSTEPSTVATSQNIEEVFSNVTLPVSCTSEKLNVSADVMPLDWKSSLESLISSERHSFYETQQYQPKFRQSLNRKYQLVYRKEDDDETIFQMEQSIAKIERISHQFCCPGPNHKKSSICIKQDYKVTGSITCTWQWITAISMVFILILLM